jgi:hypothetical protein
MEAEFPENAQGVLYSLGGFNGGITVFVKDGKLTYEYNLFQIVRTQIKGREKLPTGKVKLEVSTSFKSEMPGAAADIVIKANGEEVARGTVPVTAAAGFTTFDCLDFGTDLGSPVSKDYYDQAPFAFTGRIENTTVKYTKSKP